MYEHAVIFAYRVTAYYWRRPVGHFEKEKMVMVYTVVMS